MFNTLHQLFNPKNKDIRKRIYFTLAGLLIFSIGTTVTVPGTKGIISNLGFLELINVMGGGALKKFSIFGLGVMPYISASIVMQFLQMDIVPYFSELKDEGPSGRQKINQYTRYLGIFIAFIQGFSMAFAFGIEANTMEYLRIATIMTAGTAFLLWLGDQMTQKGIGNGTSLIIMAGIINTTPQMFIDAFNALITEGTSTFVGIVSFSIFVLVYLVIIIGIIYIEGSERRIPVQYANQTSSAYGKQQQYIPFKLNSAGVMPVILASTLISAPSLIATVIKNDGFKLFIENYINYTSLTGFIIYMLLIFLFSYIYTMMQMRPDEMSKNLNRNGGYIPGIRPGKDTTAYIKKVLSRLTIVGAIFLIIIAGLPIIFGNISSLPTSVTIGGTGVLIVVGIAVETYKQLESSLVNRSYKKGRK